VMTPVVETGRASCGEAMEVEASAALEEPASDRGSGGGGACRHAIIRPGAARKSVDEFGLHVGAGTGIGAGGSGHESAARDVALGVEERKRDCGTDGEKRRPRGYSGFSDSISDG
jgi:hypothetical protein